MAHLNQAFDATQVEPNTYEPLPSGDYIAIIESSEIKPTKTKNGSYLALRFQILNHPDYAGRKLFENLNLENPNNKTVEIARRTLSAICRATGELNVSDSEQLHNKPMTILVGIDKSDSARNRIKAFKPLAEVGETNSAREVNSAVVAQEQNSHQQENVAPWNR